MIINRYNSFKDKEAKFRSGLDAKISSSQNEAYATDGPAVSIVMPVYNAEKYILETLDSIANQTFDDWELIMVNDGSTDQTAPKITKYIEKKVTRKSKIQIISQKNGGAGAARNQGLLKAKGEYLWIIDDDDFFDPNCLELLYSSAKQNDADLSVGRADQYLKSSNQFRESPWTFHQEWFPPYQPFNRRQITGNLFKSVLGWSWDKLFKHSFVEGCDLKFQEIGSSNDLAFVYTALACADRIATVDEVVAHYQIESEESVSKTRDKHWQNFYLSLSQLKSNLKELGLFPELERQFVDYSVNFILWHLRTLNEKSRQEAVVQLKQSWNQELGIADKTRVYFYDPNEFDQFMELLK
jgi:glycosyltransferase involved in cell wall biosynthesis